MKRKGRKRDAYDYFEVKDPRGITETQQKAMVRLYGISLPNRRAELQPFVDQKSWTKLLGISRYTANRLYKKGLVDRKARGSWEIRLSAKGFENMGSKPK